MYEEYVVLKVLGEVPSYLADAAGPAVALANDDPLTALLAAALLVGFEQALAIEDLVAEVACRGIPGLGPWRLLEDGFDHGAVLEVSRGVAFIIAHDHFSI